MDGAVGPAGGEDSATATQRAARLERAISVLPQGDVRRLQGSDEYRLRIGDWRVLFRLDWQRHLITVLVIAQRGQV